MFSCVFVAFQCNFLGQVWYLIVSVPDLCLLPYFHSTSVVNEKTDFCLTCVMNDLKLIFQWSASRITFENWFSSELRHEWLVKTDCHLTCIMSGLWKLVHLAVERPSVLHFSVDTIFMSFGIMVSIVKPWLGHWWGLDGQNSTAWPRKRTVPRRCVFCESYMLFLPCFVMLHARLFVDALWSPAGKGLTSWLSFVMSNCDVVTFPLVSWVRCGAWLYRFLIFAPFLFLCKLFTFSYLVYSLLPNGNFERKCFTSPYLYMSCEKK